MVEEHSGYILTTTFWMGGDKTVAEIQSRRQVAETSKTWEDLKVNPNIFRHFQDLVIGGTVRGGSRCLAWKSIQRGRKWEKKKQYI